MRWSEPSDAALGHAVELCRVMGIDDDLVDAERIAAAHPTWPIWPHVTLSELVGPPHRRLQRLDLRWLHRLSVAVTVLDRLVAAAGGPVGGPTALSLVVERARMLGHRGWGTWSAGTSCRLLRAADGWVAVNLPRQSDLASVPALVGASADAGSDAWETLGRQVPTMEVQALEEQALLLGLPVAAVPHGWDMDVQRRHRSEDAGPVPVLIDTPDQQVRWSRSTAPTVIDLTSLWAGPLAGWYLQRAGADVVKVESSTRPDGARAGAPAWWRRLNGAKTLVQLPLETSGGVEQLRELVATADIVLEGSRPRAMEQFGIEPAQVTGRGGLWCSITGYGRSGPWANRVAFGDDAAAAGGLVTVVDDEPWFVGDAAADPISGVTAAAATLALWSTGRSGVVDVAMRDAVAHLTDGMPVPNTTE